MKSNYNLPKTKSGVSSMINAIATGKKSLDDIKEDQEIKVLMKFSNDGPWNLVGDNRELKPITDDEKEALTKGDFRDVTLNIQ